MKYSNNMKWIVLISVVILTSCKSLKVIRTEINELHGNIVNFVFGTRSPIEKNPPSSTGIMIVKNLDSKSEYTVDLSKHFFRSANYSEEFLEVFYFNNIFMIPIGTTFYEDENIKKPDRKYSGNDYGNVDTLIIDPSQGTIERIRVPENFRLLSPVSSDSLLIASLDVKEKYNNFYKENMPYYNIGKIYNYNFRSETMELVFDNFEYRIDFDNNQFRDSSFFIFDRKMNILLIVEELESKYETKKSKPQSLKIYNLTNKLFYTIDTVTDPNPWDGGYFEIVSIYNDVILYKKYRGNNYTNYLFDLKIMNHLNTYNLNLLQIISNNQYIILDSQKSKISIPERFGYYFFGHNLPVTYNMLLTKLVNDNLYITDLETQIEDTRGDFSNFDSTIGDYGRRKGFYIEYINDNIYDK
jgi:hypothetical protein